MSNILREMRDERPELSSKQLQNIFLLLLDRKYNTKEAQEQEQVCMFFAEELRLMLADGQQVSNDTIENVRFIFDESHSIFNYHVSSNGAQLTMRLAKQRYPDSGADAQRDADFVQN